jgi:uncharacterized protein (DUF1501 family)
MLFNHFQHSSRRKIVQALGGLAAMSAAPSLWAQPLQAKGERRLIVVFLRGAYDGLSAFVPYTDPQYVRLRSSIAVAQLRRDFSAPGDVIAVMSEFGRTSAENGTRGTDHGHGNAMWLIGDAVQGGRSRVRPPP